MPTISMFYGIIVRMYYAPNEHPPPHFHVYYAEHNAKVDIRTCEMMEGQLPRRQTKLVLAWAELHQEDSLGRLGTRHEWRGTIPNSTVAVRKVQCILPLFLSRVKRTIQCQ